MRILHTARRGLSVVGSVILAVFSPPFIVLMLTVAGLIAGVIGVHMLLGAAWAVIAASAALLILAVVMALGMIGA